MADKNPQIGDVVALNTSWKMLGYGWLPTEHSKEHMIVIKKCKSGLYQCAVPRRGSLASIAKRHLKILGDE